LPGVGKYGIKPPTAGREPCSPSTGPEASLNRKPQDKRQGNSESSHVPVAETSGLLLPDPFASVVTGLLASPAIWAAIHFWAEAPRKSGAPASREVKWQTAGDPHPGD